MSASNITKPLRLSVVREVNPFTGSSRYVFRLRDKYWRRVGLGEGSTKAEALTSGRALRSYLEAQS